MTKRSVVAAIAMLAVPAVTMAQPSFSATVGGSNNQTLLAPQAVSLAIQGVLNSDGLAIGGWQHSLKSSHPALFAYGDPVWAPVAPWTGADLAFSGPTAGADLPGGTGGEISVFKSQGENPAVAGEVVETINVVSKGILPEGTYTFSFGDSGQGFLLISNGAPGGAADIVTGGAFTLTVLPEPASALLLLGALPFLRRRKVS